jgi:hypothetical protein
MGSIIGRSRWHLGIGALASCVGALFACSSAVAARPAVRAAPSLFSIPSGAGSLLGPSDKRLTLRMSGGPTYLTRFTDRPLRQAFAVANVDFARQFNGYFASSNPNAVLTYTPRGSHVPVSIVLTIGQPRWNAKRATWTFPATRIRKQPDNVPGTTVRIKPALIANPRSFTSATLLIDDSSSSAAYFVYFTEVEMADGSEVPITDVKVGDQVMSTDLSGNPVSATIWDTWSDYGQPGYVRSITLEDGHSVMAFPYAVLYDEKGNAVRIDGLLPEDKVQVARGAPATVRSSDYLRYYNGPVAALGVTGPTGTFFANGFLVGGAQQ